MTARDEAIEAAARAIFAEAGPECIDDDGADAFAQVALAAAVPVLLNDLADRIEDVRCLPVFPPDRFDDGFIHAREMFAGIARAAGEGWGSD